MKKILAFLAVAVLATASQAVTYSWASGTINSSDAKAPSTTAANPVTGYVFYVDATTWNGDIDATAFFNDDGTQKSTLPTGATLAGSKTSAGNGMANVSTDVTGTQANPTYAFVFYVDPNGAGGKAEYIATKASAYVDGLGKVSASPSQNLGVGTFSPVAAVPEPTTIALLALGLAAFGLKRKV